MTDRAAGLRASYHLPPAPPAALQITASPCPHKPRRRVHHNKCCFHGSIRPSSLTPIPDPGYNSDTNRSKPAPRLTSSHHQRLPRIGIIGTKLPPEMIAALCGSSGARLLLPVAARSCNSDKKRRLLPRRCCCYCSSRPVSRISTPSYRVLEHLYTPPPPPTHTPHPPRHTRSRRQQPPGEIDNQNQVITTI